MLQSDKMSCLEVYKSRERCATGQCPSAHKPLLVSHRIQLSLHHLLSPWLYIFHFILSLMLRFTDKFQLQRSLTMSRRGIKAGQALFFSLLKHAASSLSMKAHIDSCSTTFVWISRFLWSIKGHIWWDIIHWSWGLLWDRATRKIFFTSCVKLIALTADFHSVE